MRCTNVFCRNIIKFSARNVFIEKFLDAISVGRQHESKQQMYFQISVFHTKKKKKLLEIFSEKHLKLMFLSASLRNSLKQFLSEITIKGCNKCSLFYMILIE